MDAEDKEGLGVALAEADLLGVALASPMRRLAAFALDVLLMSVTLYLGWLAFAFFFTFPAGQTPAKRLLGLRVVDASTGRPVGRKRMLAREVLARPVGFFVSGLVLYVPLFMLVWDERRQELWDKMARTLVTERPGADLAPLAVTETEPDEVDTDERALAWLRALPLGAVLRWEAGKDMRVGQPFCTGHIDVGQPDLQAEVGWGWVWDIWPPDEEDDEEESDLPFMVHLPYDAWLEMRILPGAQKPAQARLRRHDGSVEELAVEAIDAEVWEANFVQRHGTDIRSMDSSDRACTPVWTAQGVSAGLEAWAAHLLSRVDLRFVWDSSIPNAMVDALSHVAEAVESGQLETPHEILPGVLATDQVADFMAAHPESAERITEMLNNHAEEHRPRRQGRRDMTRAVQPTPEEVDAGIQWFVQYMADVEAGVHSAPGAGPHACPCCKYLTLAERGDDEICPVCFWHDDGQDDPHADEVWGGPNRGLSLTEARANFRRIGASDERRLQHVRAPLPEEFPT